MQNLARTLALEYGGRGIRASDDATYTAWPTIFVDGGLTLYADFREPWSSE